MKVHQPFNKPSALAAVVDRQRRIFIVGLVVSRQTFAEAADVQRPADLIWMDALTRSLRSRISAAVEN
ncbi:hypothetical protein [Mesorhizobium sp.]|uniref:hypothetical protein n=1 Tax=Mesorhizobium sp. TaxID=1871066 RepID=UPI000FE2A04F|nr:hypothetical protein [Mesorhizobium sp.]RWG83217.1 MAG: hypothetical protein EOQ70_21630 [Mesorhizobium sp.]RWK16226.1 MAG: hypothetical protein EOR41_20925 [Mesorhizobium sp.]